MKARPRGAFEAEFAHDTDTMLQIELDCRASRGARDAAAVADSCFERVQLEYLRQCETHEKQMDAIRRSPAG